MTEGAEIEPVITENVNNDEVVAAVDSAENVDAPTDSIDSTKEKAKKQTRSRRPNRNTQKKPRTIKRSTKKSEEDVNE